MDLGTLKNTQTIEKNEDKDDNVNSNEEIKIIKTNATPTKYGENNENDDTAPVECTDTAKDNDNDLEENDNDLEENDNDENNDVTEPTESEENDIEAFGFSDEVLEQMDTETLELINSMSDEELEQLISLGDGDNA